MDDHNLFTDAPPEAPGPVHAIDPRARIVFALAASLSLVAFRDLSVLAFSVVPALALCAAARTPFAVVFNRLLGLNLFMATLFLLLPIGAPGRPLLMIGQIPYSADGLVEAARIALRGNAIVLVLTAFIGGMEPVTFGHAMQHLRVPAKLVQLFLFTVRYIAVLDQEQRQLRTALKVRAFEPRLDLHTLRTYGNLVGMLLVRALDRSERIHAAMRCRAFHGVFFSRHEFGFGRTDALAGAILSVAIVSLAWMQWA